MQSTERMEPSQFYGAFRPGSDQNAYIKGLANGHAFQKHAVSQHEFGPTFSKPDYVSLVKKGLGSAEDALLVRGPGGPRLIWKSDNAGLVGIVDPSRPGAGTAFRPRRHGSTKPGGSYLADKARVAGAGNVQRLDLAKARDPRVTAKPLYAARAAPSARPPARAPIVSGASNPPPRPTAGQRPAALPAKPVPARPVRPAPATPTSKPIPPRRVAGQRPAAPAPKPVPPRPVRPPTVVPAPKAVPPRPPVAPPRTPVRPPPPPARPPTRPPGGGASRPGR